MESSNLQITKHVEAIQKIKNLIAEDIKYHEDQINKLKEIKYTTDHAYATEHMYANRTGCAIGPTHADGPTGITESGACSLL